MEKNEIVSVTQRKKFFSNFEKNEGVTKWNLKFLDFTLKMQWCYLVEKIRLKVLLNLSKKPSFSAVSFKCVNAKM